MHIISILIQDEYLKAYYAAILEQQKLAAKLNQQESAGESTTTDIESATTSSDRQVGMKSKREDEEEEDVEWEEQASVTGQFEFTTTSFPVCHLVDHMKQHMKYKTGIERVCI